MTKKLFSKGTDTQKETRILPCQVDYSIALQTKGQKELQSSAQELGFILYFTSSKEKRANNSRHIIC